MSNEGVFAGVRVIELAQYVFVPGAGVLLADQGAEVIKVETPGVGDPYRSLKVGDGREVGTTNLAMEQNNRNKKSVAIDLKSKEGREVLMKLIESADVFLTSLRPKALTALRLDPDDLLARNPRLIYARGNGYGFKGDEADKAGFDASAFWARGGLLHAMSPPGNKLAQPRAAFGDHTGSISLSFGIAGALFQRERTGKGQVVETSLLQTAAWVLSSDVTYSQTPGYAIHAEGSGRFPLMQNYATRDGRYIMLMLLDPRKVWPSFCRLVGLDDLIEDPRFVDNPARMKNAEALRAAIAAAIGARDWDEWKPGFEAWDAPWELVQTVKDLHDDPQTRANDMILHMPIDGNDVLLVGGPTTWGDDAKPVRMDPSPALGEHTEALLAEAGYDTAALSGLKERNIVQ